MFIQNLYLQPSGLSQLQPTTLTMTDFKDVMIKAINSYSGLNKHTNIQNFRVGKVCNVLEESFLC